MKECPWCGGKYYTGYEVAKSAKTRRSSPTSFCSSDCWRASDYKTSLGLSISSLSLGVIFSVLNFAFPTIFQTRYLDVIFVVVAGFGLGLASLWIVRRSRIFRKEIPKDSRRGQRLDEQFEYRDY